MNGVTGLVLRVPVTDMPAGVVVSQFFGSRPAAYKAYGLAGHEGIDYACHVGSTVVATADGQVWRAGDSHGPWGVRVILKHEFGFTVYAHMTSVDVAPGQGIAAGQVLGKSGKTGNVTGPHLHFALALPEERVGYACPAVMGAHWWHDPLLAGDALFVVRGGALLVAANDEQLNMRCRVSRTKPEGDVW